MKKFSLGFAALMALFGFHIVTTLAQTVPPISPWVYANASGTIKTQLTSSPVQIPSLGSLAGDCVGINDASGTLSGFTCSGGTGASSTLVHGTNGVAVAQIGINATATLDTAYAAVWTALETFSKAATINGTTTLGSTTNAIAVTNASGQVLAFAGSNPCTSGQAAQSISATGTLTCVGVVTSTAGNWTGTWQGVNSSTFYLASNPSGYIALASISATLPIVYNNSTGVFSCPTCSTLTTSTLNGLYLQITNNLSDLNNSSTARTNVGIKATSSIPVADANGIQTSFGGSTTSGSGNCLTGVTLSATGTLSNTNSGCSGGGGGTVGPSTSTYLAVFNASGTVAGYLNLTFNSSTGVFSAPTGTFSGGLDVGTSFTVNSIGTHSGQTLTIGAGGQTVFTLAQGSGLVTVASGYNLELIGGGGNIQVVALANCSGSSALQTNGSGVFQCGTVTASTPSPLVVKGIATSTIEGDGTNSQIPQLNTTIYLPADFATNGCNGSSTMTDFGTCANALYATYGANTYNAMVWPNIIVTPAQWHTPIVFGTSGTYVNVSGNGNYHYGGTGVAVTVNDGNSYGHIKTTMQLGTLYGSSTPIFGGVANSATTTAITCGGANGCVGVSFQNFSINGFGTGIHTTSNAYLDTYDTVAISGWNGGVGYAVLIDPSSNSGESLEFKSMSVTDGGNATGTKGIYISDNATADLKWTGGSIDDAQFYIGIANPVTISQVHFENADQAQYPGYAYIYATSSAASTLSLQNNVFDNDSTAASSSPPEFVEEAVGSLNATGNYFDKYGNQTVTTAIDHSIGASIPAETVTSNYGQNSPFTFLINQLPIAVSNNGGTFQEQGNSYPVGIQTDGTNVGKIYNGNQVVGTFDASGNFKFLGNENVSGTISQAGVPLGSCAFLSTCGSGGGSSGTVTTSTAFTSSFVPVINGATSIGNSTISQNATGTGVGTTTPRTWFDVFGNSGAFSGLVSLENNTSTGFTAIDFYNSSGTKIAGVGAGNPSAGAPYAGNLYIGINSSTNSIVFLNAAGGILSTINASGTTFSSTSTFNSSTIFSGSVSSTEASALILANSSGVWGPFGGSACSATGLVNSVSAVGGVTCLSTSTQSTNLGLGTAATQNVPSNGYVISAGGSFSSVTVIPVSGGGTNTSTSPLDGQILSSNTTNPTWKTLTAGTNITITTTTSAITINSTASGSGTVTTSSVLTANTLPISTSGSALGNSKDTENGTSSFINNSSTYIGTNASSGPFQLTSTASTTKSYVEAGSSTVASTIGGTLGYSATSTGNGAGASTSIETFNIPTSTFLTIGDEVDAYFGGTFAGTSATNKQVQIQVASTTIFDTGSSFAPASVACNWFVESRGMATKAIPTTATATTTFQWISQFTDSCVSALTDDSGDAGNKIVTATTTSPINITVFGNGTNGSDVVGNYARYVYAPF